MCVALNKEQVVAGFINRNEDGMCFTLQDIYDYTSSLWNAGCGPIRLNFKRQEMKNYLDMCNNICLRRTPQGYTIYKGDLRSTFTSPEEKEFLHDDEELAKSFDLFCRLQVDFRTPRNLLDAMGFRFIHA